MNALQVMALGLVGIFLGLWARAPSHPRAAFTFARFTLVGLASLAVLLPFVWLLAAIFKDKSVFNEYIFFPPLREISRRTLNLDNFVELFRGRPSVQGQVHFWQYLLNSTVYASVGTVVQLLFSSAAGYALAKYEFRGKRQLMTFMLGSMTIPGVLLLAPLYKMIVGLGLVDSLLGLILPGVVNAYGIFLFRQACLTIPDEMLDAARVDGCGELMIYYRLVMPLVRPMAAAFCLVAFLGHWNAFFAPSIFLHSADNLTLPVVLNLYVNEYSNDYGVFLAGTALAMVPPAILFFALQREFISGLTSGAVKG
jgi:ABC-type glycerol-3-phosphate transport system permease component